MSDYVSVIVLGLVQGISEFLPISSDGHLVIAAQILNWFFGHDVAAGKDVEVLLHLGTLGSIVVVYARDIWQSRRDLRLWGLIALATIPAVIVGLTLEDWFDQVFDSALAAGFGLLITAALLGLGQALERGGYSEKTLPWPAMVLIGCFQALALLPGVSRSGCTIVAGLLTGMDRISATRLSFLLALPVTAGAIGLTGLRLLQKGTLPVAGGPLLAGVAVSFLVGCVALQGLIRLVTQRRLHWFAMYCAIAGLVTIAACLGNGSASATPATAQVDVVIDRP